MKKKIGGAAVLLFAAGLLLTGCGTEKKEQSVPLYQADVDSYVTLGDYNNLNISVPPVVDEATQEQLTINTYLTGFTAENGGITDRAVQTGDTVNISYVGKMADIPFDGGTADGTLLTIGSHSYIDGFEDGLIGVMPGETVDLDLTFPDPYLSNMNLSGEAVVFTTTVNCIVPEVNGISDMKDEVVVGVGIEGVSTVDELWQRAYDYLYQNSYDDYVLNLQDAILDKLVAQCTFGELPEAMVEANKALIQKNLEDEAAYFGMTVDEYASNYGMSAEEFVNYYGGESTKQDLACQAIANRENLNISDEELQSLLEEYAAYAGYATVEEFLGETSKELYRNYFMTGKVLDFLAVKYLDEAQPK